MRIIGGRFRGMTLAGPGGDPSGTPHPVRGRPQPPGRVARAEACEHRPAVPPADDPHQPSALRSVAASAIAPGSGETPASIQRLPVM